MTESVPWTDDLEYTTNDHVAGLVHLVDADASTTACRRDASRWPWRFRADYFHPWLCERCRKRWQWLLDFRNAGKLMDGSATHESRI